MYRLNVRCCCQPKKILGTLEVQWLNPVQQIRWVELPTRSVRDFSHVGEAMSTIVTSEVLSATILIKPYGENNNWEQAVYSDDRPIEFWRKVPGFIEAAPEEEKDAPRDFRFPLHDLVKDLQYMEDEMKKVRHGPGGIQERVERMNQLIKEFLKKHKKTKIEKT